MKKHFLLVSTALLATAFILGCNMIKGAGEDVENAGKSVQEAVDKNS